MRMTKTIFNELCNDYAYLYVVRLYNDKESFYKVGITSKEDCTSRFKSFPYEYDIIKMYKYKDSGFIMDLESKLLSLEESYRPLKEFGGCSECIIDTAKALEFVDTLSWIKGLSEHFEDLEKEAKCKAKAKITDLIGSTNFTKMCKEYLDAIETGNKEVIEFIEGYDEIFRLSKLTFKGNISNDFSAIGYRRSMLEQRLNIQTSCNDDKLIASVKDVIKVNKIYSKEDIKSKLQAIYDREGIKKKATATNIKQWFTVKATTNNKGDNCFKIIKKL